MEDVLNLQPMITPKRFDIFFPLTRGCSEGLDAFRYFLKQLIKEIDTGASVKQGSVSCSNANSNELIVAPGTSHGMAAICTLSIPSRSLLALLEQPSFALLPPRQILLICASYA